MKKLFFITSLFISFASISHAQGFKYNLVRAYAVAQGYGIGQEWNCGLKEEQYFTKTFVFQAGVEYDIIALSEDEDVLDVDIEITTPSGTVFTKDTRTSAYAEVSFTTYYTCSLTIKVKNYQSNTPNYASKVYFLIAYKN